MTENTPLATSTKVLRWSIVLNWVFGALILAGLIASIVAGDFVLEALGAVAAEGNEARVAAMRQIMVLGILSVPITHVVLTRLLAIVRTVAAGDPFIVANASRLRTIAWSVVGLEVLHFGVGIAAYIGSSDTAPLDIDWNFSMSRWITILLLFVLAQAFEHGARMREELEGTI